MVVDSNVKTAMEVNIFGVLNAAMKKYKFAKHSNFPNDTNIGPFKPDFTSRLKIDNTLMKLILAIEIKRKSL